MRTVFLKDTYVPEAEAKLSIYDLSVMQAAAAFEMTRSFNSKHFKLREHLERLEQSCKLLHIPMPMSLEDLELVCYLVSEQNDHGPGEEHRLLIVVSPGCAPMYRDLAGVIPHPFVYVADFPLRLTVKGMGRYFTEGVRCVTSPVRQVPDECIPSAAKHRSRLHFHLAQMQAPEGTWPLMEYYDQRLEMHLYAEAPGANLVHVEGVNVFTWERECLPGISLQTVKELTGAHRAYPGYGLNDATELWLTGTPFCMLPVVSLDGKPIGDGKPGPVYKQTLAKWGELVGLDIQAQIQGWDGLGNS